MEEVIISVDLGGTQIRVARLDTRLNIQERKRTLTLAHEGLEPTLGRIKQMIESVMPTDGSIVKGIGVSAPGPLNPLTGVVVHPPNLDGWHNVPLGDILHEAFGVPVYVGNDANVAALAEHLRGAARGNYREIIFVTISTGIGSGIISDGRMVLGRAGLAAELGHIPILVDGGKVSTVERESSGPHLARKARERISAGEQSMLVDMVAGDLSKIQGDTVGKAAQEGDKLAVELIRYSGFIVGLGLVTLLHLFNSEIIVIGGGVSKVGDLIFDPIKETIEKYAHDPEYYRDVPVVPAGLGGDVSIFGAGALVVTKGGVVDVANLGEMLK